MPMPHVPIRAADEHGAFLLSVVILTLLLGGLSLAFLQEGLAERTANHHHETSLHALEIAESGLIRAELEIRALEDPSDDGVGVVSGEYGGGFYEVTATQDANQPDRWTLDGRGERDLSVRRLEIGLRRRESGYFIEGLFSDKQLTLNGTIATDSYDSRKGTWDEQAIHNDHGGRYAGGRGHVGSNEGIVVHGSSAHVRGNAIPGPLFRTETSGHPEIWGDTLPRLETIPLPPPTEEEFLQAWQTNDNAQLLPAGGNGGDGNNGKGNDKDKDKDDPGDTVDTGYDPETMSLRPPSHAEVVLTGGTYFFSDITLKGQASIVIQGPCRIYVTGSIDLTGGSLVNETGRPADCLVFAHPYALPPGFFPKNPEVKVNGGADFAAAIYAPGVDVTVGGGGDIFGSVVAKTITVHGNAEFHYDEALRDVDGGTTVILERLYWREIGLSPR